MKTLEMYTPEEFGTNKDAINSIIMEQACQNADDKLVALYNRPVEFFIEPDVDPEERLDENTPTRYKDEFQRKFDEFYDEEYDRIASKIGFDYSAEGSIRKEK